MKMYNWDRVGLYNNNISSVIPQVGSGKGKMYGDLNPTFVGVEMLFLIDIELDYRDQIIYTIPNRAGIDKGMGLIFLSSMYKSRYSYSARCLVWSIIVTNCTLSMSFMD